MGNVCSCLEDIRSDQSARERVELLQKGDKFVRSIYLGLSSQELFVRLSEDSSTLSWRTTGTSKLETGEIDMTTQVKVLKPSGHQGIQFVGPENKVIFEVQAEDSSKRDYWVVALNEILNKWEVDPSSKPKSSITAAGTTDKTEYFKNREAEILANQKEAAERKKKYSAGGMKYTAMIMASKT